MSRSSTASVTPAMIKHLEKVQAAFGSRPFSSGQAIDAGLSRDQLRGLARTDLLRTILRGVHQVASSPVDLPVRAAAAALILPEGAAIGRRTAAWLLGVDPRSPDERGEPLAVECLLPLGRSYARHPGLRCYVSDLDVEDLVWIGNVPCTCPARTAADLLRWLPPYMGLAVVDALSAAGLVDVVGIQAVLERWPGRRFVRRARRLAQWVEPLTESFGESWLRLRILEAGFPKPAAQIQIQNAWGTTIYRLDLGWPDRKIGIEYDGLEFHSSPEALAADRRRREDLRIRYGWQVIGVGMGEVFGSRITLESGIGELLGLEPAIRRRTW